MSEDTIGKLATDFLELNELCFNDKHVIVTGKCLVANVAFSYRKKYPLCFNFSVATYFFPHEFCPAYFKKAEIICVVDDSSCVGIAIYNPVVCAVAFLFHLYCCRSCFSIVSPSDGVLFSVFIVCCPVFSEKF